MGKDEYVDPEKIRAMIRTEALKAAKRWEALPWWKKFFFTLQARWWALKEKFRPRDELDDFLDELEDENKNK